MNRSPHYDTSLVNILHMLDEYGIELTISNSKYYLGKWEVHAKKADEGFLSVVATPDIHQSLSTVLTEYNQFVKERKAQPEVSA